MRTENRGPRKRTRSPTILVGLACVFVLAHAGCSTKPAPTRAEIQDQSGVSRFDLASPWRAEREEESAPAPIQDNWLATFGDAQLSALVVEAIANNPDLQIAAVRVEQATQHVELAKAALRPSVNIAGTGGLNMGGGDVSSALQGALLGVSWEPDLWGRLRYGRNAAQATQASVEADYEFARQSLAATVAKAWFTASETGLELQTAQGMVDAAGELVTLADKRLQVGPGSEQEVAIARANLGNFEDSVRQLRFAHDQSLRALELLLGRYPSAELEARSDLPEMPGPVPTGLPLDMLERRPDMIAAERRVAAAFNRVGEAKAARLPRIVLNASISALQSDILELKDDFENPVLGAGGRLIAPIYQGGALKTQVQIRTLEQKEAIAHYARLALQALGDVETSLAAGYTLDERRSGLEQVVANSSRALELLRTQYRVGMTDLRVVEQQQIQVYAASITLLRVRSEQLSQRANLHLVLGGSFEAPVAQADERASN